MAKTAIVVAVLGAVLVAAAGGGATARTLTFARDGILYDLAVNTTSGPRRLAGVLPGASEPAWSHDGRRLAYATAAGGDAEIAVLDPARRVSRRLTSNPWQDTLPAWSPDGRRLAFASDRSGAFQIWVMSANGGSARQVTTIGTPAHGAFYPAWSPDGRRIAFASAGPTPENQEIYTVRPDGSGLRRLTFTAGDVETLGDDAAPAWSADGRHIVFASNRTGGLAIWKMRADGGGQRLIVDLPRRDDGGPAPSPDGAALAFDSRDSSGKARVVIAAVDGSASYLSVRGEAPAWRPSGASQRRAGMIVVRRRTTVLAARRPATDP